jgi:hypothetical protein
VNIFRFFVPRRDKRLDRLIRLLEILIMENRNMLQELVDLTAQVTETVRVIGLAITKIDELIDAGQNVNPADLVAIKEQLKTATDPLDVKVEPLP